MRLIETTTMEVKEFFEPNIPHHANSSQTWDKGEVTYDEMVSPSQERFGNAGYLKDYCKR